MAKKKSQSAKKLQPKQEIHRVAFQFSPSALIEMAEFINTNMDRVNDDFGGISLKLSKEDFLFKIRDVSRVSETKDDFLSVELKPDDYLKHNRSLFIFNKRDIKHMYIDFDQKITYKSEIVENDKKQNASYVN